MKQIILIVLLMIQGCGKESSSIPAIGSQIPDEGCKVEDVCTYNTNVSGYECGAVRVNGATSCLIEKQDYQTDPTCDPANPNGLCTAGGWGSPSVTTPCCKSIQGPGPAVH